MTKAGLPQYLLLPVCGLAFDCFNRVDMDFSGWSEAAYQAVTWFRSAKELKAVTWAEDFC